MTTPLLIALLTVAPAADPAAEDPAWLHVRGGLPWTAAKIAGDGPVRVAFLGGSITEGNGYRPLVEEKLKARFPDVAWEFHNAGVSSTGSTTGVFRYVGDAFGGGGDWPVGANLVVAEAAVNDDQDEQLPAGEAGWGMEGVARMSPLPRLAGPDLLFVHFPNPPIVEKLRAGEAPISVAAHERVAEHYAIPSVNVAAEVARRIDAGTLSWEQYGGTHPGPVGHELAAEMIAEAIARGLVAPADRRETPAWPSRREPLRADAIDIASLLRPGAEEKVEREFFAETVSADAAWATGVPDWEALPGSCRDRFQQTVLLHTAAPGATLTVDLEHAVALGLYVLAGPDAGALEVSAPGEAPKVVQLYHDHSKGLHYPRTVLLYRSDEPPAGPLTVKVVTGDHGGAAVRIVGVGIGIAVPKELRPDAP
ncbi:SGNH/GDSL hydrolase family protein [Alienimonas californiensis]|nr:SGNH/GDSL hydrolase family protein [Alienimonas californiensis]